MLTVFLISNSILLVAILLLMALNSRRRPEIEQQATRIEERLKYLSEERAQVERLLTENQKNQFEQIRLLDEHRLSSLKLTQETLQKVQSELRTQLTETLNQHGENLGKRVDKLTEETQQKLKEISGEVDKRLSQGFEKTTATFADVMKRLTIIDEAQKKITELSSNVVSLQEILSDKKSRGAFGEVQLNSLIRNMIPEHHYSLQHTLSNGKRVDCLLLLPEPTGNVAIDAKFPLEYYQQLHNANLSESDRKSFEQNFRQVVRKQILDISEKYIIPGETSDGAILFIPAEAIFAEIHANFPDLIDLSHRQRVWLASPNTMMAILTTTRAVLKDAATRKQIHIIQEHLLALAKDFERFQGRMDNLARHIDQAHKDVGEVHKSSQKITSRFSKIEKVEITLVTPNEILLENEKIEED